MRCDTARVFGELFDFPFETNVWGTFWQAAGSVLTGVSFFLAYRVYKSTVERERRSQATLVTFDSILTTHRLRGVVYNHSSTIIRDVHIVIRPRTKEDDKRIRAGWSKIAIIGDVNRKQVLHTLSPVAETEFGSIRPDVEQKFEISSQKIAPEALYAIELWFTDAAGIKWRRFKDNGELAEAKA